MDVLFARFVDAIRRYDGNPLAEDLLLAREGAVACHYAPFDWVNPTARLVLVGITPGHTQANNALLEARAQLLRGAAAGQALLAAKRAAAFSGPMRPNLVGMLDHIGLARWLGLKSCDELFGQHADLLQSTSVLPFPVFVDGENYKGNPDPLRHPLLKALIQQHFVPMAQALPRAIYVPLGPVPTKVLDRLVANGHLRRQQVLAGLPHPSTANAERIAYFVGSKARHLLSAKTDPDKLDRARADLLSAVQCLELL